MKRTHYPLLLLALIATLRLQSQCPAGALNNIQGCLNAGAIDFNTAVWTLSGNSGTTAGSHFIGTIDASDFVLKTNSLERLRLTSGGNLGIGIAAPTELLDVNGKLRVRNLTGGLNNVLVTASNPDGVLNSLAFTGNSQDVLLGNATFGAPPGDNWGAQNVATNGTLLGNGTGGNLLSVHISADAGNQLTAGGDAGLFVAPAAGDADWYETGGTLPPNSISDDKYTMGKVGIGTSSPATSLDVNGVTTLRGNVDLFGDVHLRNQGSNSNGYIRFNNGGAGVILDGGSLPIRFDSNIKFAGCCPGNNAILNAANEQVLNVYMGLVDVVNNPIRLWKTLALESDLPNLLAREDCEITFGTHPPLNPANYNFWISNGNQERVFTITGAGNTGIATTTPSEKLHVVGNVLASAYLTISDRRFKKEIQPLEEVLQKIQKLEGVTYQFRTEEFQERNFAPGNQIGLIAQNVEAVYPELVKTYEDGFKAVNYEGLIPVLLEGLKAQQKTIENLETEKDELAEKVAALGETNASLQSRLADLEARMNQLVTVKNAQQERIGYQEVHPGNRQQIILSQNDPNPFSERTSIRYFLPDGSESAELFIHDAGGNILKRVELTPGDGIVEVFGSNLSAGFYSYSIVANGRVVEMKKMVKVD